jgi:hypothetical protein
MARKWRISGLFRYRRVYTGSPVFIYENISTEKSVRGFRLRIRCMGGGVL